MVNPVDRAEMRLTLNPISDANGIIVKIRPSKMYSGAPGGWGTPKIYEQAINSPQSQNDVVGAIVRIYTNVEIRNTRKAMILLRFFSVYIN